MPKPGNLLVLESADRGIPGKAKQLALTHAQVVASFLHSGVQPTYLHVSFCLICQRLYVKIIHIA